MEKKPTPQELLGAIHKHCLECSGGSRKEVHRCKLRGCALWFYREADNVSGPKQEKNQITIFDYLGDEYEHTIRTN